jgi:class 3 adenylate cyclase/tetratricopeptide (TPR) repeat protein
MSYGTRKTVTVIFVDVAGSTRLGSALDPEPLRRMMLRYFDAVSDALRHHEGSVEKFIGDAVMAVFGVPAMHEDDALRAVRAAIEARAAIADLNDELEHEGGDPIEIRIGINTGEVFAGEGAGGAGPYTLVTGDAVNVAARLQYAASPGQILIGSATRQLVRDSVRTERVDPLTLRGKDESVDAWQVVGLVDTTAVLSRHFESPLVGRSRELSHLELAFERAVEEQRNHLFTILGPAGIGKSRLAAELSVRLSDRARIVSGRCLPYGEGITFWPLREIVQDLASGDRDAPISSFLKGHEEAEAVAARIAGAIGHSEVPGAAEETFWAVRKLFEALARERPLVVVFEDIHWAEPTLLDLIDHVAEWSRDAPLLLLCLARPELLETRPSWGGGKLNSVSLILEALTDAEADALIDNLLGESELPPGLRGQIADRAEGNPLFVEQMLALLAESDDPDAVVEVPPTIQTLLSARLDLLSDVERMVVERAAVVGTRFWSGAVAELVPGEFHEAIPKLLASLVRKELIRPDASSVVAGEEGYRFRHILIRDAAYSSIAKELRADLHERFATLIETAASSRLVEIEEILGYHLEQAYQYRAELSRLDDDAAQLAARAARHLASAGRRALARGDISAAANLLSRTAALVPPDAPERIELLPALGAALVLAGDLVRADEVLTEAIEAGRAAGDRRVELHARLEHAFLRSLTNPEIGVEHLRSIADEAIPELEALGDDLGLAKAWRRVADVHWMTNRWAEQERALERALTHAERAGDPREAGGIRMRLAMALYWGPTPTSEAIERAERTLVQAHGNHAVESTFLVSLAGLHAMSDRFEESRALLARGEGIAEELGFRLWFAGFSLVSGDVELLAGDLEAAERKLRRGYRILDSLGERRVLSTVASRLAKTLYLQGRDDGAEAFTKISEQLSGKDDLASQIEWRSVRAKLLARRGELKRAERLARKALALAEQTDDIGSQANALVDLAEVLRRTGRTDETDELVDRARVLFERKGNVVAARAAGEVPARAQP